MWSKAFDAASHARSHTLGSTRSARPAADTTPSSATCRRAGPPRPAELWTRLGQHSQGCSRRSAQGKLEDPNRTKDMHRKPERPQAAPAHLHQRLDGRRAGGVIDVGPRALAACTRELTDC